MINKKAYYEANQSYLGVGLRRFQEWFDTEESDKQLIKAKSKPKLEIIRKHKKVEYQVDRIPKKATIADTEKIFSKARDARVSRPTPWPASAATTKAESVANSIQKSFTVLLALYEFVHIKIQVSSCNFLSFLYYKKNDAPWRNSFVKFQKGNAIYNEI